ncbi:MAG: D-alanyl-D-alanine carboxypeptidase [Selenomonadaceae bacterium]|nr:D-alanyl-D-alanine carboxypeptidase [Selenomonadaceae bacterium]
MFFLNSAKALGVFSERFDRLMTPFAAVRLVVLFFCACALLIPNDYGVVAGERILPNPPAVTAESAIIVDLQTGGIIYGKNVDARQYPASTTKVMTAVLALEKGDNGSTVVVSPYAAWVECTGLWAGNAMREFDMIELMLLESDNGAATALGEAIGGSESAFAAMMNDKARELGMNNTRFANCNGMPDEGHYSTARDIAKVSAYAMQNELFRRIVASEKIIMPDWQNPGAFYEAENTNKLLESYPGCIGIKTGFTNAAGGCLVSAARRGGRELLCVVLKSSDMDTRFSDSAALLDYGFLCAENGLAELPKN